MLFPPSHSAVYWDPPFRQSCVCADLKVHCRDLILTHQNHSQGSAFCSPTWPGVRRARGGREEEEKGGGGGGEEEEEEEEEGGGAVMAEPLKGRSSIKEVIRVHDLLPASPELMLSINDFKALKALFTSRSTGIGRKGRWLTAEDLEAYLYALSQPGALTGALNYYRNVFSSLPLSQNHVRSPVLLLWGERDTFLEQEMAEACRLYIRNHFRLNIISGASHWLQQDQPDIVNTLIWTFLKEGEGRKSYRN
ncbi:epoxide hydrolase 4 [Lates japonicus]|uniref:Epoxide hydrolase 4 n=1 Tax=Lates japonicus TaxID=270547 RepID=A0AAD3N3W3_LATJO|nr:epoxide hydrolase 4 [Lates japonicus]